MNVRIFSVCVASLALSALASPFDAAMLVGADGKRVQRDRPAPGENWFGEKGVFFDGGAGADVGKIAQGEKEPADFDAFWARQRKELAKVPGSRHGYIPPKK